MKVIRPEQASKVLPLSLAFEEVLKSVVDEPVEIQQAIYDASASLHGEALLQDQVSVLSAGEMNAHLAEFYDQDPHCRAELEAFGIEPSPLKKAIDDVRASEISGDKKPQISSEDAWDQLANAGRKPSGPSM
ncbi:hypothetical protein MnBA_38460 [Marinobacterium sp. BA1]